MTNDFNSQFNDNQSKKTQLKYNQLLRDATALIQTRWQQYEL